MSSIASYRRALYSLVLLIVPVVLLSSCMEESDEPALKSANKLAAFPIVSDDSLWNIIEPPGFPAEYSPPTEYAVATLDFAAFQALVDSLPIPGVSGDPSALATRMSLPMPEETFGLVNFERAQTLDDELMRQFPQIGTFSFDSVDMDPTVSGFITTDMMQFYVTGNSASGLLRIDPVMAASGEQVFVVYWDRNRTDGGNDFVHTDNEQTPDMRGDDPVPDIPPVPRATLDVLQDLTFDKAMWKSVKDNLAAKEVAGDQLRTFRFLASTTDVFYQNNGNSDFAVLLSLAQRINAVNAVMEPEISVRLILDADSLDVFNDNTVPDGSAACTLRDGNPGIVSAAGIAEGDYDIGFLFSAGGTGGCAWYVACEDSGGGFPAHDKARGGGRFGMNGTGQGTGLILHETGHQLGAKHTYSGGALGCDGPNFDGDDATVASAFAPGSGSTIMSYLGSCDSDDVDISLHDNGQYYHAMSFEQIQEAINSGNVSCAAEIATGNNPPAVDAGPDYTIPRQTPFTLGGSGNDPDGDTLSFTWEQIDLATTQRPIDTDLAAPDPTANGPIIRSLIPDATPGRTIPDIRDLLDGTNQPMNGIQRAGELVPQVDRSVNMRLSARDGRSGGGGVNSDDMLITVSGAPHFITSPNSGSLPAGCTVPVSWDPGGGNAASVDILASTTGGLAGNGVDESFPDIIVSATPNDGQYDMAVPCANENQYRIKVQASDNIYFDVNDNDLSISNQLPVSTVDPLTDGEVDDQCEYTVQFSGSVSDSCGIAAADVEVIFDKKPPGDFMLSDEVININQNGPLQVDVSGSVLVSDLMSSPATFSVGIKGTDNCGGSSLEFQEVNVADNIPPEIEVSVSPDSLWPPNHKMVPITATVTATDNCPGVSFELISIESNEPQNDIGDGNTEPDVGGADLGTDDTMFELRAERQGGGDGRIYTITYGAGDNGGNSAEDSVTVEVPHDKRP